jgi:hypothetical protein
MRAIKQLETEQAARRRRTAAEAAELAAMGAAAATLQHVYLVEIFYVNY